MEEDILKEVVDDLKGSFDEIGKFVKLPYENEAVEISKDNFHSIKEGGKGKIVFIDGGNTEILKSSNFSLQFVRVYYTIYLDNKRISNKKYEFYLLVKSFDNNGKIFFKTKIFGDRLIEGLEFDSFDKTLCVGKNRADVSFIGNVVRRFSELKVVHNVVDELSSGDVVVLDGSLDCKYSGEKEILDKIVENCNLKNVNIIGLSKTCELFTDKGNSMISALNAIQPVGSWYYYPIAKFSKKFDILFVKLNSKSKYIFRMDFVSEMNDKIEKVLSLLILNSKDPVFLGYPYGLIEADKMARVSNNELEMIKTKFMVKAGKDWDKINESLKTKDSHSVLDNIG